MPALLILPGYGNSGPDHWQSRWEKRLPAAARLDFGDWLAPEANAWGGRLRAELERRTAPCVLVAHSLACLVVASHVAQHGAAGIAGAFLVAPPDPAGAEFPSAIVGFHRVASVPFPVPAIVFSSSNDPYSARGFGAACAAAWGARHLELESAGHINAASGFGAWEDGLRRLREFAETLDPAR